MPKTVTIGGQPHTLADFSAFKAVYALEIIGDVESAVRGLVHEAGDFRTEYAKRHTLTMPRAEARRQYAPRPLLERTETEGGEVKLAPLLVDGDPVMGPDPLGHLTDADWEASDNLLTIPEYPDENAVMLAMIPRAFKAAKTSVLRLLALALTSDRDVETWDGAEEIDAKLDTAGTELLHKCKADELGALVVGVLQLAREQVADPFAAARREIEAMFAPTPPDPEAEPEREPMTVEPPEPESETGSSPTSSTGSPAATDGSPAPSSTAPAGVS